MSNVDIAKYGKRLVQLFYDPEPRNDDELRSPIWCLGRRFETRIPRLPTGNRVNSLPPTPAASPPTSEQDEEDSGETARTSGSFEQVDLTNVPSPETEESGEWPEEFVDDFGSRIWLTYRSGFPPIPKSQDPKAASSMSMSVRLKSQWQSQRGFTSDAGWGCMIRSGQSLLANTLALVRFGRDWTPQIHSAAERGVLVNFADDPRAPFSIHKFVEHGAAACGTYPGQWFGPSATAKCIETLCNRYEDAGLRVCVTGDAPDVYEDALMNIAKDSDGAFKPTLLLVGTRLGINGVTPVYWEALKASFQMPQSVGIAGGRPSASHYFVGSQGNNFFYLDPHQTRPALPFHDRPEEYTDDEINSCHTRRLRRMPIEEMDPSMLIGFLFRTEEDWRSWRRTVSDAPGKAIFHVADTKPLQYAHGQVRDGAIDEVETLDDDEDAL